MPVIHPVGDAPDACKAIVAGQDDAGYFTDELSAAVESVYLLGESGIFNVPDQGHGTYS